MKERKAFQICMWMKVTGHLSQSEDPVGIQLISVKINWREGLRSLPGCEVVINTLTCWQTGRLNQAVSSTSLLTAKLVCADVSVVDSVSCDDIFSM